MPDIVEIIPIREIGWAVTVWHFASFCVLLSIYLGVHLGRRVLVWFFTSGFIGHYRRIKPLKDAARVVYEEARKLRDK